MLPPEVMTMGDGGIWVTRKQMKDPIRSVRLVQGGQIVIPNPRAGNGAVGVVRGKGVVEWEISAATAAVHKLAVGSRVVIDWQETPELHLRGSVDVREIQGTDPLRVTGAGDIIESPNADLPAFRDPPL
jgi:hypothetical protein